MRQVLFQVPGTPIKIFGFGLMLCLALLSAIGVAMWRARREKLDPETIADMALWSVVCGLIGARAFYVIQYWGVRIHSLAEIFQFWEGGIVFYGGLIGGAAGVFLYWIRRRFPLLPTLDAIAPALAIGLALGRVGCFLNGCCYGDACDMPWGVQFPPGSPPWWNQVITAAEDPVDPDGLALPTGVIERVRAGQTGGVPWSHAVHPSQLYSAVDGFVLFLLLSAYYPLRRRDGEVAALFLSTYPVTRLLIEEIRGDEAAVFAGMTISQNVSVLLLLTAAVLWSYLLARPAGRYADRAEVTPEPATAVA